MEEYLVDLSAVTSWEGFVAAFNRDFIRPVCKSGWDWDGNLDGFNDFLWWPEPHPYRLRVRGWLDCAGAVDERKAPDGRPVLDVIGAIFRDNVQVEVVLD